MWWASTSPHFRRFPAMFLLARSFGAAALPFGSPLSWSDLYWLRRGSAFRRAASGHGCQPSAQDGVSQTQHHEIPASHQAPRGTPWQAVEGPFPPQEMFAETMQPRRHAASGGHQDLRLSVRIRHDSLGDRSTDQGQELRSNRLKFHR